MAISRTRRSEYEAQHWEMLVKSNPHIYTKKDIVVSSIVGWILGFIISALLLFGSVNKAQAGYFDAQKASYSQNYNKIVNIVEYTRSRFLYVSDIVKFGVLDYRISYFEDVKKGRSFSGDCDEFAYTVRDLLIDTGYRSQLYIVSIPSSQRRKQETQYHMITRVWNKDISYMVDNRNYKVLNWDVGLHVMGYVIVEETAYRPSNR